MKGDVLASSLLPMAFCDSQLSPLLQACDKLLADKDASMTQKKVMARTIHRLVIPLNTGAATLLRDAAISVAPMTGCGCFHKSREVERRKEAETEVLRGWKKSKKVTVPMELIANYLTSPKLLESISPRTKRVRTVSPQNSGDEGETGIICPCQLTKPPWCTQNPRR